jgi:Cof subfamily protein (haloacid dehalogenase superfamily)
VATGGGMTAAPPTQAAQAIDLMISDIDGTLLTPEKTLTPLAIAAVRRLGEAGVGFTLVSSRPPRGMAALIQALDVRLPFAGFNGANIVDAQGALLSRHTLAPAAARTMLALLEARGVDAWVFADGDWRLRDPSGVDVDRERRTVGFDPVVVKGFDDVAARIDKIVGVSSDHILLIQVEAEARARLGADVVVQRSQPYYLDATHPLANKGDAVKALCRLIGVAHNRAAVIGDMFNDTAMFAVAGLSIAMGQAPAAVKAAADVVTADADANGFAQAIDRFILGRKQAKA